MRPMILCTAASVLTLASLAPAQTVIDDSTPSAVTPLLEGAGDTAKLDKTGKGPQLKFKAGGDDLSMEFLDCVGSVCPTISCPAVLTSKTAWT